MPFTTSPIRMELGPGSFIRQAEPDDFSSVLAVLSQMHEDAPALSITPASRATFQRILAYEWRVLLVVESSGRVISTLDLFLIENLTREGRPWAGIENFVVDKDFRRKGIGRQLLDAAISIARSADCYKVQLVSHESRHAAHALYARAGFTAHVRGYRYYLDR